MNVELPPEMEAFIEQAVTSGRDASREEFLVEAVRMLIAHEELRAALQTGLERIDQGEFVDGFEKFAELEADLDAMIARQQAQNANQSDSPQ